jgi:hypothetical protein
MGRLAFNILGGVAIVAGSFFGTLFILNRMDALEYPDSIRSDHAKMIKAALEKYRSARGAYPSPFTGNPLSDLKPFLVDTGYLRAIPEDPDPATAATKQYRYVSDDGKVFGILLPLKFAAGKVPAGGNCVTGVGSSGRGWWSSAPDCPF